MPDWLRPLSYEFTFMVYARRPITMREISRLVNDVACWSCDGFSSAHIAAAAAAAHATCCCCCCCRSSGRSFRARVCVQQQQHPGRTSRTYVLAYGRRSSSDIERD